MISETEAFLKEQTKEYQHHSRTRNKLSHALSHQQNMKLFKTVPKQYLPPTLLDLPVEHPTLSSSFLQKYHDLFFEHLDSVITHNLINLELEEARLRDIVSRTEEHLSTLTIPRETIKNLYQRFLAETKISNHQIHPDLLQIFHTEHSNTVADLHSPPPPLCSPLPSLSPSSSPPTAAEPPTIATAIPPNSPVTQSTKQKQRKRKRCNHHRSSSSGTSKKSKQKTPPPPMSPPPLTSLPSSFLAQRSENKRPT